MMRILLYILAVVAGLPILFVVLFLTTMIVVNFYDPPVNPEILALEAANPLPADLDNAYIFYHGIDAPEGEDPMAYALTRPAVPDEEWVSYSSMEELQAAADAQEEKKHPPLTPEHELAKNLTDAKESFSNDTAKLRCILGTTTLKKYDYDGEPPCATDVEAKHIFEKHKILLDRYQSLSRFPRSAYVFRGRQLSSADLTFGTIEIHSMAIASMLLKARQGHAKEALNDWIESMKYLNIVLSDQNSMLEHAMVFVQYSMNLKALPVIVNADAALAKEYAPVLTALFSRPALGEHGVDLYKVFLAERRFIQENMKYLQEQSKAVTDDIPLGRHFYKENDMMNDLYAYYKDFKYVVEAAQDPSFDLSQEEFKLQLHNPMVRQYWRDMIYNPIGNMLSGGQMKGMELYGYQIRKQTTDMRMLGAYILALADNISPPAMPEFLLNLPDPWKNAFSLTPFLWDEKTSSIYYERTVEETPQPTQEEMAAIIKAQMEEIEFPPYVNAPRVQVTKRYGVSLNTDTAPSF